MFETLLNLNFLELLKILIIIMAIGGECFFILIVGTHFLIYMSVNSYLSAKKQW